MGRSIVAEGILQKKDHRDKGTGPGKWQRRGWRGMDEYIFVFNTLLECFYCGLCLISP
jgi:hypothetical protein